MSQRWGAISSFFERAHLLGALLDFVRARGWICDLYVVGETRVTIHFKATRRVIADNDDLTLALLSAVVAALEAEEGRREGG